MDGEIRCLVSAEAVSIDALAASHAEDASVEWPEACARLRGDAWDADASGAALLALVRGRIGACDSVTALNELVALVMERRAELIANLAETASWVASSNFNQI